MIVSSHAMFNTHSSINFCKVRIRYFYFIDHCYMYLLQKSIYMYVTKVTHHVLSKRLKSSCLKAELLREFSKCVCGG